MTTRFPEVRKKIRREGPASVHPPTFNYHILETS